MPEAKTKKRAARAKRQGKSVTTQAGEFVREEMEHVKKGIHGVKSRAQAIAIGLSKARRAGVKTKRKSGTTKARNRAKVPGAKSTKPPQRNRRSTAKTGSRRAPTGKTASGMTRSTKKRSTGKNTSRKTSTGRSRKSTSRKTSSRSKK